MKQKRKVIETRLYATVEKEDGSIRDYYVEVFEIDGERFERCYVVDRASGAVEAR